MDIVKKVRPLKATYESLGRIDKLMIVLILVSLVSIVIPHQGQAQPYVVQMDLFFEIGDYTDFMATQSALAERSAAREKTVDQLWDQIRLAEKVEHYLITQNSPLAQYSNLLMEQNNWKKILALANAESTLCRKYIETTANCWGVGGSNLWDLGNNLGEGIVSMNNFLNNYPLRSNHKYTDMSFEDMNGFYKQPARDHWVDNNYSVYVELVNLENSL